MKITFFIAVCCLFVTTVFGAEKDNKFGKVTDDEVKMSTFSADSSAAAVVLYEKGTTYYQVNAGGLQVCLDVYAKIKILKSSGTDYAIVKIPYEDYGVGNKEYIQGLDGYAYNYENGKVEKTRLSKEYITTENTDGKHFIRKFTIPNVKAGTLIEYKYSLVSDFERTIRSWRFQWNIPVCQSICDVLIPEYFTFHINVRGYYPLETINEPGNQTFSFPSGGMLNCISKHIVMKATNLPAIKKDKYVAYINDYVSSVSFEMSGIQIPGTLYKSFSYTWQDVEKQLMDDNSFGGNLKQSGLLKEEVKAIKTSSLPNSEKITALYQLVQSKVKWNNRIGLYSAELKKALKNGEGSSSEINFSILGRAA